GQGAHKLLPSVSQSTAGALRELPQGGRLAPRGGLPLHLAERGGDAPGGRRVFAGSAALFRYNGAATSRSSPPPLGGGVRVGGQRPNLQGMRNVDQPRTLETLRRPPDAAGFSPGPRP